MKESTRSDPRKFKSAKIQSWFSKKTRELRSGITKSESILMQKLLDAGFIHHKFQCAFKDSSMMVIADFYIRKIKVVVEVDGGYHRRPEQIERDLAKDEFYKRHKSIRGVLRLTDRQAIDISLDDLKMAISGVGKNQVVYLY